MAASELILDLILCLVLLSLAVAVVEVKRLYDSIILFIAFGLILSITWARLGAPDLALAEAAIGAGITGVLLMAAYANLAPKKHLQNSHRSWLAVGFSLAAMVWLVLSLIPLADSPESLVAVAEQAMADSGVTHPVTAVLLNFRAWDTLLELVVLLLALLGMQQLRLPSLKIAYPWPLLNAWGRYLAPLTIVIGGYLLWRGSSGPGGAFQSGALLAAGLIVLRLNHVIPGLSWQHAWLRCSVLCGAGFFLIIACLTAWLGQGWLDYPASYSASLIFIIEFLATISIAVTLAWLVTGQQEAAS
ncbi:MAG: DUF4040 domain-containing protein [Methylophaga sp.]|nr:DUF4040 domain-containing protein [Methylophaga sp.]